MNKPKNIKSFKIFSRIYHTRSLTTQLIATITIIFLSFFALQLLLNAQFFKNYYTEQEFNDIHQDLMEYVDEMNAVNDNNYYDEMFGFTSTRNVYSLITTKTFSIHSSEYKNYTVTVEDQLGDEYTILLSNIDHEFTVGESYIFTISPYSISKDYYIPQKIKEVLSASFVLNDPELDDSDTFVGQIIKVEKPFNLNYQFDENLLVQLEVTKLASDPTYILNHSYSIGSYWYKSTDGPIDTLVFVHDLGHYDYVLTIIPIEDTTEIAKIVSSYNYFVYLTAIIIITLWSFRLSALISKPIKNIEMVAKEIANLNFDIESHEYSNKETASLSQSINLISRNLKETLETLSTKNEELMDLYSEQSTQVNLKKQLVSSISHELKTPLMIMQITIQAILDGIIPKEDNVKELENVISEINKSSIMIQDLLQIYRLDDASTALELTNFNLSKSTHFFINDFDNVIKKYNFTLDIDIEDDVIIYGDKKLIKRVISNYLTNAIKYTPEKEKITIEIKDLGDQVLFQITNYGVSLDEDELLNIWIPFFRIDKTESTRLKTKGTGIGLYLVSEILKAHEFEYGISNVTNGIKAYFITNKKL
ncbi:MAG: HAMP domain-containing sensor histidine kinase [Candidatus Izemoplasma sp.]